MNNDWVKKVHKLKYSPKEVELLSSKNCRTCNHTGVDGYRRSDTGDLIPRICTCVMKLLKTKTEEELDEILTQRKTEKAHKGWIT